MASSERQTTKIVVSVASTLIACTIIYFTTSWWATVRDWFVSALLALWHFLLGGHSIPRWLLVILSFATVLLILRVIAGLRTPKGPHWSDYTEDAFFGVRWRWDYSRGEIQRPVPFCAHCDIQLVPLRGTEYGPGGQARGHILLLRSLPPNHHQARRASRPDSGQRHAQGRPQIAER